MDERTDYERQLSFRQALEDIGKSIERGALRDQPMETRAACEVVRLLRYDDCKPLCLFYETQPCGTIVRAHLALTPKFDATGNNLDSEVSHGTTLLSLLKQAKGEAPCVEAAIRDAHHVKAYTDGRRDPVIITPTAVRTIDFEGDHALFVQHKHDAWYAICMPNNPYAQQRGFRKEVVRILHGSTF
jgi:hypothetical protein